MSRLTGPWAARCALMQGMARPLLAGLLHLLLLVDWLAMAAGGSRQETLPYVHLQGDQQAPVAGEQLAPGKLSLRVAVAAVLSPEATFDTYGPLLNYLLEPIRKPLPHPVPGGGERPEDGPQSRFSDRYLASDAEGLILTQDIFGLYQELRDSLENNPDVRHVFVLDRNGQVLAHSFPRGVPARRVDLVRYAREHGLLQG